MKIVCDACSAKYSIADEKVKGKVFKIRCKKCSNIIVVRGSAGADEAALNATGGFDQKETRVYDYGGYDGGGAAAPATAAEEAVWHIVVNQEQVGPVTQAEVQARLASGEIDADTYTWREGFADWVPLSQIPELASTSDGEPGTAVAPSPGEDAVANMFGAASDEEGGTSRSDPNDVFAAHTAKAEPAADEDDGANDLFGARTAAKAPSAGDELFGAGGKSSPGSTPRVSNLKSQRSENSVLFSLNNLAALASDAPKATAAPASSPGAAQAGGGEGSGLIDIRSMASAYHHQGQKAGAAKPGSNIGSMDDLPVFSTAAFTEPAAIIPTIGAPRSSNKMIYVLAAAVAALTIIAAVLIVVLLKDKPEPTVASGTVGADSMDTGGSARPTGSTEPSGSQVAAADPTPAGGTAPVADKPAEPPPANPPAEVPPVKPADAPADKPVADKPVVDKPADKPADKPTKPADKADKSDRTARSSTEKPSKPEPEKPEPAKADKPVATGGCMDEVQCLLADKPPACCSRYGKSGSSKPASGGGGGGGGGGGNSNLPDALTKSDISEGVGKVRSRVDGCAAKSSAKGTVKVSVKVSGGGTVSSVTVKESPDPGLASCVQAAMQKATFTKTQNGGSFSYPFIFR